MLTDRNIIRLEKKFEEEKQKILEPTVSYKPEQLIFAMDIGTRTVIGLVGVKQDELFKVIALEVAEHTSRAMLDGQIHDIAKVVSVAAKVKEALEKKLNLKLSKVAIAAAGRVLKTCQVRVDRDIPEGKEIDSFLINSLEMEGVQKAQNKLETEILQNRNSRFYCVGYSVVNYYLNDLVISELLGHKGYRAGAEILATFLPHVVVDSLYTVMDRIGLEVVSLTLEPIAALNVAIPKDLRLLNLALVDIGAGTSDIAITKNGTVTAYAMVSVAGDEITEAIAKHYLVDFKTAEDIKISLSANMSQITFTDVLDNKIEVTSDEVEQVIKPVVEELASTISKKILEYNGKSPNAVFLIGGGSQVRGLSKYLAEKLKLHKSRVAVRNRNAAKNVVYDGDKLLGPESITPMGIMVTADMQKGQDFFHVTVNGKKIKLFNSENLKVSDALILLGYNPDELIGKSGKSIKYILNGKKRTLRGEFGKPAKIEVNGKRANLGTLIKPADIITVLPAEKGRDAYATLSDILSEFKTKKIYLNGSMIELLPKASVNGNLESGSYVIKEGDEVSISLIETLEELALNYEVDKDKFDFFVNEEKKDLKYCLQENDKVECKVIKNLKEGMKHQVDNEGLKEDQDKLKTEAEKIGITVNGKKIFLENGKEYIFVDIFQYIDFDLSNPKGSICLELNERKAAFTDKIKAGDIIKIYWR